MIPQTFQDWQDVMDPLYGGWRDRDFNLSTGGMMLYNGWFFPYGPGVIMRPVKRLNGNNWQVSWYSNRLPPVTYYVWVNGKLVRQTSQTSIILYVPPGDAFEVFVYDDSTSVPPTHYPRRIEVYWLATEETYQYRVEQYVGAAWVSVFTQRENGKSAYLWESDVLDDQSSNQFRVVAVGDNENETVIKTMTIFVVRRPDVQNVGWTYNEVGGTVELEIT